MKKSKLKNKNWRKVKLGEVGKIITGKTPSTFDPQNFNGPYPFITIPDLKNQRYIEKTERTISEKGAKSMKNLKLSSRTVIVSCLATVGEIGITIKESFTNQQINAIICKKNKIIPEFLYYYLEYVKPRLLKYSGSVYTNISKSKFADFEAEIPEDINDQKRIAAILSAFDDKIELNNKINKTLEEMVQAIFKEWFVDFKFPGHEKVKFVDSELGKIPKGWEVKDAEEIINFEKGVEPGSAHYGTIKRQGFVSFYRVRDLNRQNGTDVFISKDFSNGKFCKENDILLSLDATVGRIKIGCNGAFSSGIRKVYSKDDFIKSSFIYFWLKTQYVQNTILEYASGTTILHAGNSLKYLKLLFNKEMVKKFQKTSDPIFNKILDNIKENQKLASLRDLLLPKLMSGEIRV